MFQHIPLEQVLETAKLRKKISIGLPKPSTGCDRRFPLTPEAAGMLVEQGFVVKMQAGGAADIHYEDEKYSRLGVNIVQHAEAIKCDIVICLSPIDSIDARLIRRGAMLLTMLDSVTWNPMTLKALIMGNVLTIALDLVSDGHHNHPFADILSEISGRSAIAIASALLADTVHGKGILLGGIAGIVPCEVTILGSGIDACAAASSAIGLGAIVRMFDNDVYRLRTALSGLGPGVSGSALHPRVLQSALRSADVVVATALNPLLSITGSVTAEMKIGVIVLDLFNQHPTFPSLKQIDLSRGIPTDINLDGNHICYTNPANAVPRTAAMAMSNALLTMFNEIFTCDGVTAALMLNNGLQAAALTFMGKAVNPTVASLVGVRHVDIKLLLQFT